MKYNQIMKKNKKEKIVTYVLTLSLKFPKNNFKEEKETLFFEKIEKEIKKHTIRGNYKLWKKRFKKIQNGEAILSLRYWSGKPYNSKQVIVKNLSHNDGIGIQSIFINHGFESAWIDGQLFNINDCKLNENDGLSFSEFKQWFNNYDLNDEMAIIHFTNFRY